MFYCAICSLVKKISKLPFIERLRTSQQPSNTEVVLDCADVIEASMTSSELVANSVTQEQLCTNRVDSESSSPVATIYSCEHSKFTLINDESLPPSYATLYEDPPPSYEASVRFQEKDNLETKD